MPLMSKCDKYDEILKMNYHSNFSYILAFGAEIQTTLDIFDSGIWQTSNTFQQNYDRVIIITSS